MPEEVCQEDDNEEAQCPENLDDDASESPVGRPHELHAWSTQCSLIVIINFLLHHHENVISFTYHGHKYLSID